MSKHTPYGYNVSMGAACRRAGYASTYTKPGQTWPGLIYPVFLTFSISKNLANGDLPRYLLGDLGGYIFRWI